MLRAPVDGRLLLAPEGIFKFTQPVYSIANRGGLCNLQKDTLQVHYITNTLHYSKMQEKSLYIDISLLKSVK